MAHNKIRVSVRVFLAILLVLTMSTSFALQGFASELIFHSGFEPNTVGVPVVGDEGAINDITGIDNSFPSHNSWLNNLDNYPGIGNFNIQYETKDNFRQRYANITDDPTGVLFSDSFDEIYSIGSAPRIVSNDKGKRNWGFYTSLLTEVKVQADPKNTPNQVMMVRSLSTAATYYPKLDKVLDLSASKKVEINYSVLNKGCNTYLDIELPTPKTTPIRISGGQALIGESYSMTIDPEDWTAVSLECDFENNLYTAMVNGEILAKDIPLFSTQPTDFSNVKLRLNSGLSNGQYYYLDNVEVKKTPVLFEDDFDLNYSIGSSPRMLAGDKSRTKWSGITADGAAVTVQADPQSGADKVLQISSLGGSSSPLIEKIVDASSSQKITVEYQLLSLGNQTALELKLPTVSSAPAITVVNTSGNLITAGGNTTQFVPNQWNSISVRCDLYNNTYSVAINGVALTTNAKLFSKTQTDFRGVSIRFRSDLSNNSYFLNDVTVSNTANKVLKYYGGKVINDSKLRIQSQITGNSNMKEYYYKYRFYLNDGFDTLKSVGQNISGYWLTLAEFFDGSNWQYVYDPDNPVPNYCSRVSMGIARPTGAGNPLKFTVNFEHATLYDDDWILPPIWDYDSQVDVPINKWATMEIYLKQGIGSDPQNGAGQFAMYLTTDDGVRQTVFDIYNDTYQYNKGYNGIDHAYLLKFYGNKYVFNNVNAANGDLQVYWDDLELRTTLPQPELPGDSDTSLKWLTYTHPMLGTQSIALQPDVTDYNVVLPFGISTQIPQVAGEVNDGHALITALTQAPAIPGSASVAVRSLNGTERTYRVQFSIDTTPPVPNGLPGNINNLKTRHKTNTEVLQTPVPHANLFSVEGSRAAPLTRYDSGTTQDKVNAAMSDYNPYWTNDQSKWVYGDRNPYTVGLGTPANPYRVNTQHVVVEGTSPILLGEKVTRVLGLNVEKDVTVPVPDYYSFTINKGATIYLAAASHATNYDDRYLSNGWTKEPGLRMLRANNAILTGDDGYTYSVPNGSTTYSVVYSKRYSAGANIDIPNRGIATSVGLVMFVVWDEFNPNIVPAPAVSADDVTNTIIGLNVSTMEYAISVDGGVNFGNYTDSALLSLGGHKVVKVRKKAVGDIPAGDHTILTFTPNPGDVSGDGIIDITDVIMVAEIAVGYSGYTPGQAALANVSSKTISHVDISDVVLITERVCGSTTLFPVELP